MSLFAWIVAAPVQQIALIAAGIITVWGAGALLH